MQFHRMFTRPGVDPLETAEVETRVCQIAGSGFSMDDVVAPKWWSQNAVNVVAQKYLRKAGVPDKVVRVREKGIPESFSKSVPADDAVFGGEMDVRQAIRRMAGCWTYWGFKRGLFDTEKDGKVFFDEACHTLLHQMWSPNSPQWFNTGLHWAYGIERPPQGHFYYDEGTGQVVPSQSAYERPQPHACFIQSVADDLVNPGGIMDLWLREARLFKYGSGTGTNFSSLRGRGEMLSGGGASSGLLSWLKIGDRAAAGIKSGGTTRRAAKMVLVNCDHPEIMEFVNWKVTEEQKVLALVAGSRICERRLNQILTSCCSSKLDGDDMFDPQKNTELGDAVARALGAGISDSSIYRTIQMAREGVKEVLFPRFTTDWQGEAYDTVSGQQANNSVGITNSFLDAVEQDGDWNLIRRTDRGVHSTLKARDLWAAIVSAAWGCADPGLQFLDTMNEWHTCPNDEPINGSNPCAEYMFIDDTACNLASLNLVMFESDDNDMLQIDKFRFVVQLVSTVLEISIMMSQLPSAVLAQKTWQYRTTGIGYANLGAFLMRQGLPYDSDAARGVSAAVTSIMTGESYAQSARLASELGAFDRFQDNAEPMLAVIRNHYQAAFDGGEYSGLTVHPRPLRNGDAPGSLISAARQAWATALDLGTKHGYRNAQVSCLAPTGTISIAMDCDTTGVEPDFSLVKFKALAGGGGMTIVNQSVPKALSRLGYTEEQIDDIVSYVRGTRRLGDLDELLVDRGFTGAMIKSINNALSDAPHLLLAISTTVVGREAVLKNTNISEKQLDSGVDLMSLLGFSGDDIDRYNDRIIGAMTVEGAPHLIREHLAVFDCATKCGLKGKRYISPDGHLKMLGAVQPFLSGGISKTVNMPRESTKKDIEAVYQKAWKLGLKAVALYRDGSKLSQPLESRLASQLFDGLEPQDDTPKQVVVREVVERLVVRYLADRHKLPWTRRGYTQKAVIDGHKIFLRTGEYEDGSLGEIFIDSHKEGAAFRSMFDAFAMAISVGLQHGVPLERFVSLFTFTKFEPNGMVMGDPRIQICTSMIDYIFRNLAVNYLGRDDLAHVSAEKAHHASDPEPTYERERVLAGAPVMLTRVPIDVNSPGLPHDDTEEAMIRTTYMMNSDSVSASVLSTSGVEREATSHVHHRHQPSLQELASAQGYLGFPCAECNEMKMVQNGTCAKCANCGAQTGCS